jgi:transcriptional accessory protein Tex/SPT6
MSNQDVATAEPEINAQEVESMATTSEMAPVPAEMDGAISDQSAPLPEEKVAKTPAGEASPDETGSFSIYTLQPGQKLTGEKVSVVVSVGQEIEVWVKKVDQQRGRISLTMIKPISVRLKDIAEEAELEGVVTRLESYGVFVDIGSVRDGLVHISQITHEYIKHPQDALAVGDTVKVKVLKVNRKKRQIDLSIKALLPPPQIQEPVREEPRREDGLCGYAEQESSRKIRKKRR